MPFLAAMGDVAAQCRGARSLPRASALATRIADVVPIRALAVGSLARCDARWADGPELLDAAGACATAAAAFFRGESSRRELEAELLCASTGAAVWTTLPLVADDGRVRGVLVAATSCALDERAVAFLAFVARELAFVAARRSPAVASAPGRRHGDATRPNRRAGDPSAIALLGDAAYSLFSGLSYTSTIRRMARAIARRRAAGCVVVLREQSGPRRLAHAPAFTTMEIEHALAPLEDEVMAGRPGASPPSGAAAKRAAAKLGASWIVCVPIREAGEPLGALTVFGTKRHRPLPIALAGQLAAHAAAAVANGRRYRAALEHVKARDEALATLSHDLKSPISAILMNAALILKKMPDVEHAAGRPQVESIVRCATRMRRLVGDLLDLAALDDGATPLRPAPHALHPILREVFDVASAAAQSGGVELVDALADDLPNAYIDATRIGQVLANIVDNAIRHTPHGGRVVASARAIGGDLEIAIADTGCGIEPAQLAFVFDRFWRAPAATKKGSGLGLAICKTLVELSGGRIEARSTLGAGTTITFTVPSVSRRR